MTIQYHVNLVYQKSDDKCTAKCYDTNGNTFISKEGTKTVTTSQGLSFEVSIERIDINHSSAMVQKCLKLLSRCPSQ